MTLITQDEFIVWLMTSKIVKERSREYGDLVGNYSFVTTVEKDGILYLLADGGWVSKHHDAGYDTWYSVSVMYRAAGQEGDGI